MAEIPHRTGPVRRVPGLRLVEHRFEVPLIAGDDGRRIELFARELRGAARAGEDLPFLLMLNGGPGNAALRPGRAECWLPAALAHYHVLLLDQRGTGLSTPVDAAAPPHPGDAAAQAAYLAEFRADAIVRDAELVRRAVTGARPWSVLGQSFGGFAALTYLSFAPDGLREAYVTGGLPPLRRGAEDVYRATFDRLDQHLAARYLARYPDDEARWREVLAHVETVDERLPRGERLTARRLRAVGNPVGMSTGPEQLHLLVEGAFVRGAGGRRLSSAFLEAVGARLSSAATPLYAVLHEAIYAQGAATRWAADRILRERLAAGRPAPLLLGEMILPFVFEEDPLLRPFADAAQRLAERDDWPALYDPGRLAANDVPVVAAVYLDDLYVESAFSLETAAAVRGLRSWTTNEHQHDGLRVGGVLERLIAMRRGDA